MKPFLMYCSCISRSLLTHSFYVEKTLNSYHNSVCSYFTTFSTQDPFQSFVSDVSTLANGNFVSSSAPFGSKARHSSREIIIVFIEVSNSGEFSSNKNVSSATTQKNSTRHIIPQNFRDPKMMWSVLRKLKILFFKPAERSLSKMISFCQEFICQMCLGKKHNLRDVIDVVERLLPNSDVAIVGHVKGHRIWRHQTTYCWRWRRAIRRQSLNQIIVSIIQFFRSTTWYCWSRWCSYGYHLIKGR